MKKDQTSIDDLKKQWQQKYGEGNCRELVADGKSVFVFDPSIDFNKMKAVVSARSKSAGHMVDAILNNCWLGGDEELKKDEAFKLGIEDQISNMVDIPEAQIEELGNGNVLIKVEDQSLEVRKATRMDIRYAEDRNLDRKPLMTQVYLLDRIAVDQDKLKAICDKVMTYMAMLLAVMEIKDKKYVEIKKF